MDFDFGDILGGIGKIADAGINLWSSDRNAKAADRQYRENVMRQDEAFRHGIEVKVADAKRAGIHPLYALGASPASNPAVSVLGGGSDLNTDLGSAGQRLGRAATAAMDHEGRENNRLATALDLKRKDLENRILEQKLASEEKLNNQPGNPPPNQTLANPSAGTDPAKVDQEKRKTGLSIFGQNIANDPYTSDAQEAEDVMGEGVADWLWPFVKLPSLYGYNAKLAGGMIDTILEARRRRRGGFPLPLKDRRRTGYKQDISDYVRTYRGR